MNDSHGNVISKRFRSVEDVRSFYAYFRPLGVLYRIYLFKDALPGKRDNFDREGNKRWVNFTHKFGNDFIDILENNDPMKLFELFSTNKEYTKIIEFIEIIGVIKLTIDDNIEDNKTIFNIEMSRSIDFNTQFKRIRAILLQEVDDRNDNTQKNYTNLFIFHEFHNKYPNSIFTIKDIVTYDHIILNKYYKYVEYMKNVKIRINIDTNKSSDKIIKKLNKY